MKEMKTICRVLKQWKLKGGLNRGKLSKIKAQSKEIESESVLVLGKEEWWK